MSDSWPPESRLSAWHRKIDEIVDRLDSAVRAAIKEVEVPRLCLLRYTCSPEAECSTGYCWGPHPVTMLGNLRIDGSDNRLVTVDWNSYNLSSQKAEIRLSTMNGFAPERPGRPGSVFVARTVNAFVNNEWEQEDFDDLEKLCLSEFLNLGRSQ